MISGEVKLCECGCGNPAPISKYNREKKGLVKGQPMKFLYGHNRWKGGKSMTSDGYERIRVPTHPKACYGYVLSHRLIAEKALGKILPDKSPIHHHDETQLVICENDAYHNLLHKRMRAQEACGHVNWDKCKYCKQYDQPLNLHIIKTRNSSFAYHPACNNEYHVAFMARYRQKEVANHEKALKILNFWGKEDEHSYPNL